LGYDGVNIRCMLDVIVYSLSEVVGSWHYVVSSYDSVRCMSAKKRAADHHQRHAMGSK
jgi:hypothetical protein